MFTDFRCFLLIKIFKLLQVLEVISTVHISLLFTHNNKTTSALRNRI